MAGDSKMKFRMMLAALSTVVIAHGGETLGLWVFNGTAGETCADGTVVPNLVAGSALSLVAGVTNRSGNAAHLPKYVDDVPMRALYSDVKFTNRLALLNTSIHVCTGSAVSVGGYLRVRDLGAAVMENGVAQDFTIEMLVRPRWSARNLGLSQYGNGDTLFCGIGGKDNEHSPSFAHGEYNAAGGCVRAMTNNFNNIGNYQMTINVEYAWLAHRIYDDQWHHWALTYEASTRTATVRADWGDASNDKASVKWLVDGGMPLADDSCFQILGRLGQVPKLFYGATVAAVRVSKGILSPSELMRVAGNYDENPVMAWWRFENGSPGRSYSPCTNEYTTKVGTPSLAQVGTYGATTYATPPKKYVKDCLNDKYVHNNVCLWGKGNTNDASGISIYSSSPEFAMPGSFTAEGFYLLTSNATQRSGSDGNARQPLMNEMYAAGKLGWGLRTDSKYYVGFFCCKVTNLVTGAATAWSDNAYYTEFTTGVWHHVAVVYNDEASPKTFSLYLDYKHKKTFEINSGEALQRMGNGTFYLCGYRVNNANTTWFGGMDEFRFTHKALAEEEFLRFSGGGGFQMSLK